MFGLYFKNSAKHGLHNFGLCQSHESGWFWSWRAIKHVCGFGGNGWYFGFISYDTEKQVIPDSKGGQS